MKCITPDTYEATTHRFIIKVWREETINEADRAAWRGTITHVPSGARRPLHTLGDTITFMLPYLQHMGVEPGENGDAASLGPV